MSTTKQPPTDPTPAETPAVAQTLALTPQDLKDIIASVSVTVTQTVLAALKEGGFGNQASGDLGTVIGNAVADGMNRSTRRKVGIGEYIARVKAGRLTLTRSAWQNDKQVPENVLTNREIELLNKINRSGRYIDRLVQVIVGIDSGEEVVYFRYHDKKPDHRFALAAAGVRNFETMLEMIVNAQQVENDEEAREEERNPGARSRSGRAFGGSKRTREAEENAGVVRPATAGV